MRTVGVIASGLAAVLLAVGAANAAIATDTNGMSQWRGTAEFRRSLVIYLIAIDVEYCVYDGAAQFKKSFPGEALDPDQDDHYFYAYEIYNNLDEDADYIDRFTVGLDADEEVTPPTFVDGMGSNPSGTDLNSSNAGWDFNSPTLAYDAVSDVLYFSSPDPPEEELGFGTVTGPISTGADLPTPAPEPATVVLLAVGTGLMLARRRRRT